MSARRGQRKCQPLDQIPMKWTYSSSPLPACVACAGTPAEPALPRESGGKAGVLLAGEGIETVLSLKCVLPGMAMIAALSANHLAALEFAPTLARLYVARDRDAAGRMAAGRLHARGSVAHIDVRDLMPVWGDFNEDICRFGTGILRAHLGDQLAPADVLRFLGPHDSV
jgi:hypothetical protein